MTAEDCYRELLSKLERCEDSGERDSILDDLLALAHHVHFSRKEWFLLSARLDMVVKGLAGDSAAYGTYGMVN
jgi:hypothetical protein